MKQPKTRSELASVIGSGHEVIFYHEDLTNVYKQAIAIVNLYNSRNHYCPNATLSSAEQNIWRIKQAAHYLDSTVQIFIEIDKSALNTQEKNILRALDTDINHFKLVLKEQEPDTVVTRTLTKSVWKSLTGPIHPVPGPIPSTSSDLNPSGPEKKHSEKHTCHICGKVLYKLGDLNDHIRNHHPDQTADSEKPTCFYCGKVLSSKSNLKEHEKKHKEFLFIIPQNVAMAPIINNHLPVM